MTTRIAFFEDSHVKNLAPIALMRPVFELICGRFSLRERMTMFRPGDEWGAFVRTELGALYQEQFPQIRVNDAAWLGKTKTLLVNGRWLPPTEWFTQQPSNDGTVGTIDDTIAWIVIDATKLPNHILPATPDWDEWLRSLAQNRSSVPADGRLVEWPWDLVDHNSIQLVADFRMQDALDWPLDDETTSTHWSLDSRVAVLGDAKNIHVHPTTDIDPYVVLDARGGPISIDARAKIQAFTRLEGPCHVGADSQLFRANVRGDTTIGSTCRVGGEVEASILHGHVNKYHDGFLGHAYICPWVNLGALTSNSDLKNDYSRVRVPAGGHVVDTGMTKVGCFIGDHSKTALASVFNTGTTAGVMSMILPGGTLLPKHIPSFSRIWHGHLDDRLDLDASIEAARISMERRNQQLTEAEETLLRFLHENTQDERERAIQREKERL